MIAVKLGILDSAYNFLSHPTSARIVIIVALIWRWTGYNMVFYLAGLQNIEYSVYEAAKIDGLSEFGIFFKMYIPSMKSIFAAAGVVTFMNAWNNYLWAKVIMSDNTTQTMTMLISNLISGYVTDYGMLMLAVLITTIPTAIVFFALQKNFVEGITGSVK